jgi:hypothetical protein
MLAVRLWSVRNARMLERAYAAFEPLFAGLAPLWHGIGLDRAERPIAAAERSIKGFLFDCRMCGRCVLSSTGMSCPMNCPKTLRNGPCGGVRANGHCEVKPEMPCVWVKAWEGSTRMAGGDKIGAVQPPVDHRLKDTSSWLRIVRERADPVQGPTP